MSSQQWSATPLTGTFGAELRGGRVADGSLDPLWLTAMLEEHLLLVLRDQHLTHPQQVCLLYTSDAADE